MNLVTSPVIQKTWNFFYGDFSNIIGVPGPETAAAFRTATDYITRVGTLGLANMNDKGDTEWNPIFPYQIIIRATEEVQLLYPDLYTAPFT